MSIELGPMQDLLAIGSCESLPQVLQCHQGSILLVGVGWGIAYRGEEAHTLGCIEVPNHIGPLGNLLVNPQSLLLVPLRFRSSYSRSASSRAF